MNFFAKLSILVRKPVVRIVNKPVPVLLTGAGKTRAVGTLLKALQVRKALIVTDHFLHGSGLLDPLLQGMADAGVEAVVFDGVKPDPTFDVVRAAQAAYVDCTAIIAVGGGSVIDTAKAMGAAVANEKPAERLAGMLKVRRSLPPFIAVPTTAGTGSEATLAAVISDSATHSKKQLLDPKLVPSVAVLDPAMTVTLPPRTTANTALDALTHAVEAYVSTYAQTQTDRYARIATQMIYEHLPKVREAPDSLAERETLLMASFFAGMAFTRTYVGYVHAFAHTIGGKYGVPHGLACAIVLPHVMEYFLPVCAPRFAELAELTGVCAADGSAGQKAKAFVQSLFALLEQMEIPARFEKFPAADIDAVIDAAFKECHGVYPVPRYYTRAEARVMLQKVCSEAL